MIFNWLTGSPWYGIGFIKIYTGAGESVTPRVVDGSEVYKPSERRATRAGARDNILPNERDIKHPSGYGDLI